MLNIKYRIPNTEFRRQNKEPLRGAIFKKKANKKLK